MARFEYNDEDYVGSDMVNLLDSSGATDSLQASGMTDSDAVALVQEAIKESDEG